MGGLIEPGWALVALGVAIIVADIAHRRVTEWLRARRIRLAMTAAMRETDRVVAEVQAAHEPDALLRGLGETGPRQRKMTEARKALIAETCAKCLGFGAYCPDDARDSDDVVSCARCLGTGKAPQYGPRGEQR